MKIKPNLTSAIIHVSNLRGGRNVENQNIERSEHRKFFRMIITSKVKKIRMPKVFSEHRK
jgi:hypothetical protein